MNNTSTKKLGFIAATSIVAGNMMGSGIALLPSYLATIGSITMLSWVITIIGALALGYVFAKLALANPQAGGPIAYAEEISPRFGFQAGILYFYSNWIGNIGMAITGVAYLSVFFSILTHPFFASLAAILVIWILVGINLLGPNWVGKFVTIGLVLLLIPVILTGTYGWHFFNAQYFLNNWNVSHTTSFNAFSAGITMCLWSFVGLESATTNAAVTENPPVTIPRATIVGIGICALVYLLSNAAIIGMFPAKALADSGAPFALSAGKMLGSWATPLISCFAAFACFTSLGSWMMLVTQAGVRASKDGILPKAFSELNNKNIPVKGLLITAVVMTALLLLLSQFSNTAQALFGHIVSISVLLLIFPYYYAVLNFTKRLIIYQGPVKGKRIRNIICIFAALFCFAAFCGAQKHSLELTVVIYLSVFFFYERKDRSGFEAEIKAQNPPMSDVL